MRNLAAVSLIVLGACASKPGSAVSTAREIPVGGGQVRIRETEGPAVAVVAFPLDKVWRALPAVLDSLGIPVDHLDGSRHVIGNEAFKAHKRLGKTPLSKLIDCGSTQGFPSADEYDINLSVLTQVEADKTGATNVSTKVDASGRPMAFPGSYSRCTTKGVLEQTIVDVLTRRLQG